MKRILIALIAALLLAGCGSEGPLTNSQGATKEEFFAANDAFFAANPQDRNEVCSEYSITNAAKVVLPFHDAYVDNGHDSVVVWWLIEYFDGMCGIERPADYEYPTDEQLRRLDTDD